MLLHLFHLPGACSRVSLTALEIIGAPFEVTVPPLHRGGLKTPEYGKLNPLSQVPVLVLDGKPLTENTAILFTLARLYPDARLLPLGDPITEGRALSRLAFCASQLHPCVTRILFPQVFCDTSPEASTRVREQSIAMLLSRLAALDPLLAGQQWVLGGEEASIVDVYLLWVTGRMERLEVDLSKLPAVAAHVRRTRALEAVKRAQARDLQYLAALEADGLKFPPHIRASIL